MILDMEQLASDFMSRELSISCKDWLERREATQLLVDAGVPHGSSGYSEMFLETDYETEKRYMIVAFGMTGRGIEYRITPLDSTISLQEVYSKYDIDTTTFEIDEDIFQSFFHVEEGRP